MPGLCTDCVHAQLNHTKRATTYLRCLLAKTDPRFARYPQLPVLSCPGHQPRPDPAGHDAGPGGSGSDRQPGPADQ